MNFIRTIYDLISDKLFKLYNKKYEYGIPDDSKISFIANDIYYITRFDGTKEWYYKWLLHREDGPAIEYPGGYKAWRIDGKLHRLDGAAVECSNGYKAWYINGKLHREDGPAIERPNGANAWFIHDIDISKLKDLFITFDLLPANVCLQLKSKYGLYIDYKPRRRQIK